MSVTPHPTRVHYIQADHKLELTFSDGLDVVLPTVYLRGYCPCAKCQGHGAGPPKWVPVVRDAQARIEDVSPVGSYAICILFADGHDTGIYTFESLRQMHRPWDKFLASERVVDC